MSTFRMNKICKLLVSKYKSQSVTTRDFVFSSKDVLIFEDKIGPNGLPATFERKYKCPVKFAELELVDGSDGTFYCDQCKHNVFTVTNTEELGDRV